MAILYIQNLITGYFTSVSVEIQLFDFIFKKLLAVFNNKNSFI